MASFPEPRKWSNLGCGCINCGSIDSSVDFRKLALREAGDRIVKVYRLVCLSCFQQLSEETPQNINVSEVIPEISRKNENCYHRCRWCSYLFEKKRFCVSCRNCEYCCICSFGRPFKDETKQCVICNDKSFDAPQRDIDQREAALSRHIKTFNFLTKALREERKTGYVDVPGGKVWYEVFQTGNGIPLVILPGGPGNQHTYLKTLKFLAIDRSVIFYDPLGCGKSVIDNTEKNNVCLWTLDRFIEEIEILLWHLGIEKIHLFGHSYGSLLATQFALKNQSKVASLMLAGPCLSVQHWSQDIWNCRRKMSQEIQQKLTFYEMHEQTNSKEYHDLVFSFYKQFICKMNPWPEEISSALREMNEQAYEVLWGKSFFLITGKLAYYDLTKELHRINCPTLLTRGNDDVVSLETANLYKSLINQAFLVNCENSTHVPHIENRVSYVEILSNFLSSLG